MRNLLVTLLLVGMLGLAPSGSFAQQDSLPPPGEPMAKWSAADVQKVQQEIDKATTLPELLPLQKRITKARVSCAVAPSTAQALLQAIAPKVLKAGARPTVVASAYSDIADCMPFGDKNAVPILKYALQTAREDKMLNYALVTGIQRDLVRTMVMTHAPSDDIVKWSPSCPSCHQKTAVVPIFGLVPMQQKDYGYRFVNGSCAGRSQQWYCRKCKTTFFPISDQQLVIDEKP